MLSVVSSYLGRVDTSDSKRGYLCSIVGFMPLFNLGGVRETSKVVDVLLPLGENNIHMSKGICFVYITHFT
jgi:hypothetical protein